MQNLGLSDSTPKTEGRIKSFVHSLVWADINDEFDVDQTTRNGFWVCAAVAIMTLVVAPFQGQTADGVVNAVFFMLGAFGVRQRSRIAAIGVFVVYALSFLVLLKYSGQWFSVLRFVFLAMLLANVRAVWKAAKWSTSALSESSTPAIEDWRDTMTEVWPGKVWPKGKYVFYVLAVLLILGLVFLLAAPPGLAA